MQSIRVRHNMEMAHRLWALPGKCQQLHGHSWWCELTIVGDPDERGILLDFHEVKKVFRDHLDSTFDHRLCLDSNDPLIRMMSFDEAVEFYPGLSIFSAMPTVENVAKSIGLWARHQFGNMYEYHIDLHEASTNAATWSCP